ncbi:WYL domain-containing protein [Pikeienuella sp. HZG-20]|uniref:WYL domain-containing protein n=1 Tax=Paludibacillus litoralis TaxID=3133267 RepID=UPI0030EB8F7B
MTMFDAVSRWFRGRPEEDAETPNIPGVEPYIGTDDTDAEPADDTEPMRRASDDPDAGYVEPIFIGIRYHSASGDLSQRRIRMIRFECSAAGDLSLRAYCHERKSARLFRCDRIDCFFDADGEITDPPQFWRELGVDLEQLVTDLRPTPRAAVEASGERVPRAPRRPTLKTHLNLLAALSRCDGKMRPEEVDVIVTYAIDEMERDGVITPDAEIAALAARVRRMRPTRDAIRLAVEKLFVGLDALGPAARARFMHAAHAVANADGVLRPEEFDFLAALEAGEV